MKRLAMLMVAGSLVITGAAGLNSVKAAETKNSSISSEAEIDKDLSTLDPDFVVKPERIYPDAKKLPSLSELLKKDTKLSTEEKKELKSLHSEITKKRNAIDELLSKEDAIIDKITDGWAINKKYNETVKKYQTLWDKLDETATDEMLKIENNVDFIKASKAITDKEKETLIKGEAELDELDKEYDKLSKKVDTATKELNDKVDALYTELGNLAEKIAPLAKKLGGDFERNYGFDDRMLY